MIKRETYKLLSQSDKERIEKVINYWFDENYDPTMRHMLASPQHSSNSIGVKLRQNNNSSIFQAFTNNNPNQNNHELTHNHSIGNANQAFGNNFLI